jgi:DNA-binding CsgD family transcriptional regulator
VLALIAQGQSNAEIAQVLNLSAKTADNHRTNIMRKLDVHSTAELVAFAFRQGMAEP